MNGCSSACSCRGRILGSAVLPVMAAVAMLATICPPSTAEGPTTRPRDLTAKGMPNRAQRRKLGLDYLTAQYSGQLKSGDWITRSAGVAGLSQLPTAEATDALADHLVTERHPVARLVTWQAMLSRAGRLSDKQYVSWRNITWRMANARLFNGDLRVGLVEMMGAEPTTRTARTQFIGLFARTSSQNPEDIPTLIAMGHTLRSWGDRELVEYLIRALLSPNSVVRAELVLQAAGASVPWNRTPDAHKAYTRWWKGQRESFVANGVKAGKRRKLLPQYIAGPKPLSSFDPSDTRWLKQFELGALRLNRFEFAIALDCSGSMSGEIERLKRDIRVMFTAVSMIAREVGVGVTLFAGANTVRRLPLTNNFKKLTAYVDAARIMGGSAEEDWSGALGRTMVGSRWAKPGKYNRRAIVLISDEPITTRQFKLAMPRVREGAEQGFRVYGVMIRSAAAAPRNPLSVPFDRTSGGSVFAPKPEAVDPLKQVPAAKNVAYSWDYYHDLAKASGGRAIDVTVPRQTRVGFRGGRFAPRMGLDRMAIAPVCPGGGPTSRILTLVLTDAINPLHADRIEPLVKILVAYSQRVALHESEKRIWATPGAMEPNLPYPPPAATTMPAHAEPRSDTARAH